MEKICAQCHAVVPENHLTRCPACGGDIVERPAIPPCGPPGPPPEIDHRGIVLPRRHALGGIITPQ